MAKPGKFIVNNFLNKYVEILTTLESNWFSYSDGDTQSYTIIVGVPIGYDDNCGILSIKNDKSQVFYLPDGSIEAFWEAKKGFKFTENTTATINSGSPAKIKKNQDFM